MKSKLQTRQSQRRCHQCREETYTVFLVAAGQLSSSLYLESSLSEATWTNIRKITSVRVESGLVGCGVLCSREEDCTLFLLSGPDLCHLARVEFLEEFWHLIALLQVICLSEFFQEVGQGVPTVTVMVKKDYHVRCPDTLGRILLMVLIFLIYF